MVQFHSFRQSGLGRNTVKVEGSPVENMIALCNNQYTAAHLPSVHIVTMLYHTSPSTSVTVTRMLPPCCSDVHLDHFIHRPPPEENVAEWIHSVRGATNATECSQCVSIAYHVQYRVWCISNTVLKFYNLLSYLISYTSSLIQEYSTVRYSRHRHNGHLLCSSPGGVSPVHAKSMQPQGCS